MEFLIIKEIKQMNFTHKVCVITGGANGIGKFLVQQFIKNGSRVAFIDTDQKSGELLQQEIANAGGEAFFFCGDIAEEKSLIEFSSQVINRYKKVDYIINNAMLTKKGILSDCSFEDFNYVLRVGITAPYMLCKLFMNNLAANASIVNICSTRARMSQMDTESYSAAKGGILSLTHALSVSLAGKARVNSVSPGWIDVEEGEQYSGKHSKNDRQQHTAGRVGIPLDIANAVMFLCDENNGFINGQDIVVDGGMTKLMIYNDDFNWKYRAT